MTNSRMNPKVDFYFSKAKKWQEELEKLRTIVLDCGLTEELKWGCPCYTRPTESSGRARPRVTNSPLKSHAHVKMVEAPLFDISATYIRQCIANNKSIRYLVPEAVEQMIRAKGFYK